MKFLLDNHFPPQLARALNELVRNKGHEVFALRERFPEDIADVDLLHQLGEQGDWCLVTCDRQIRKNPLEQAALAQAKVTTFFLAKGWATQQYWPKCQKLIAAWPKIESVAV